MGWCSWNQSQFPEQISAIKAEVDLPVIGLYKIWHEGTDVFITPTLEAAKKCGKRERR